MARSLLLLSCLVGLANAQGGIYQRIRAVLGTQSEGERALTELAHKNFAAVEEMLASLHPADSILRSEVSSLRGDVAFLAGDMHAAIAYFDMAAISAPLNDEDQFTLAMALIKSADDQRARSILSALAQKYPQRSLYLYWLGRLDYDQHRYEEAIQKLSQAVNLDPNSPRAWDSLGLALDMDGKLERALTAFEKSAALNRELANPSAWPPNDLGFLLLRMEHLPQAEAALEEALRVDPKLMEARYHLARTLEKEGKETAALDEYKKAVNADPVSTDACYSLALLYRKLHRDQEAEAMFAEYRKRKQLQPVAETPMSSRATH